MKNNFLPFVIGLSVMCSNVEAMDSIYTSLQADRCAELELNSGISGLEPGYRPLSCPGRDGYEVNITGGDDRSWLVILKDGREIYNSLADITDHIEGNFNYVSGQVLEWRYDRGKHLIALIARVASQAIGDERKNISNLVVFRHYRGRFCYVGQDKTNKGAREIADKAGACPVR